jgi:gliding motility-associated-like protein
MTSYTWTPGNFNGSSYVVSPTTSQTYTILGSVGTCTYSASQLVTVTPLPTVSILPNPPLPICPGSSVTLNANGATNYIWQPGNLSGASISVGPMSNQTYTVTGTQAGCSAEATVLVTLAPIANVSVSAPLVLCKGDIGTLTATGASYYTWEPGGGSGSSFTVQPMQNTTYTVTASNGGTCIASTTVNVSVHYVVADFVDNSIKSTYLDPIQFTNLSVNNTYNFWYFTNQTISGEVNPTVLFDDPGVYVACLLVSDVRGCDDTLCKEIIIGCPEEALFIPNTFTPNDDGLNDVFRVSTLGQCIDSFEMDIFDRWGEVIFTTKDLAKGWDGKVKGIIAKNDVYAYLVKYTMINKKAYTKTGHVTLMK